MEKATVYKCFIASPGDTINEREICDSVFQEINDSLGQKFNFRIEPKKWENDARPSFGKSPQDVINKQLVNNFQLFIGIMFTRFGTPTKVAESGTEEEFNIAYENRTNVEIMFYFNGKEISPNDIDTAQLEKVNSFKKKLSDKGGFYSEYNGEIDFEKKLRKHLQQYFMEKHKVQQREDHSNNSNGIANIYLDRLNEALSSFSNQPEVWVDPIIYESKSTEDGNGSDDSEEVGVDILISSPFSAIIKAPPQFGLTCLAHHLVMQAWKNGYLWVYLDMNTINIQIDIENILTKELNKLNIGNRKIDCIILDSWKPSLIGSMKILRGICNTYPKIPLIIMNTMGDFGKNSDQNIKINRAFRPLALSALSRNSIRKVVSEYNAKKNLGDENIVLTKVVKDMDVLNIHRTPLNCLTLLKISEKHFDESPVNRTKMIEMFLFVLFDLVEIPTYKTKPDVKDCEHVLGFFCEGLIRGNVFDFSRDEFVKKLNMFCDEKFLDLEVSVVFDVLLKNRIIVSWYDKFRFKAAYWMYYFAANQMRVDKEFYNYIVGSENYTNFPEIIEFYTGIDRNCSDMINILTNDLSKQCDIVEDKTGMTVEFNPLEAMEWNPTEEHIEDALQLIKYEVVRSNLPNSLKDEYDDQNYNYERPYNQDVSNILKEYTFLVLKQKICASSRALRNSDYVSPNEKKGLLKQITRGWLLFSKILFLLSPVLAKNDYASFDGFGFVLCGSNDANFDNKLKTIILVNPGFVVKLFKDDLFSPKSAPLLYNAIKSESNKLIRHQLILLLVHGRPKEWKAYLKDYITHLPRNSPYLLDVLGLLREKCKYDFATPSEVDEMGKLLKMCYAKHEFKGNNIVDNMKKISNKVIPKRAAD
ncbi:MAG: hypothetical protein ACI9AT_002407 [Ulvibacter sp.]|jgi:hypothetical protein